MSVGTIKPAALDFGCYAVACLSPNRRGGAVR
jgi:hypothetical protein